MDCLTLLGEELPAIISGVQYISNHESFIKWKYILVNLEGSIVGVVNYVREMIHTRDVCDI